MFLSELSFFFLSHKLRREFVTHNMEFKVSRGISQKNAGSSRGRERERDTEGIKQCLGSETQPIEIFSEVFIGNCH